MEEKIRIAEDLKVCIQVPILGDYYVDDFTLDVTPSQVNPTVMRYELRLKDCLGDTIKISISTIILAITQHWREQNLNAEAQAERCGSPFKDRYKVRDMTLTEIIIKGEEIMLRCVWTDFTGTKRSYTSNIVPLKHNGVDDYYAWHRQPTFYF